jgi:hypothetical protein
MFLLYWFNVVLVVFGTGLTAFLLFWCKGVLAVPYWFNDVLVVLVNGVLVVPYWFNDVLVLLV